MPTPNHRRSGRASVRAPTISATPPSVSSVPVATGAVMRSPYSAAAMTAAPIG